MIAEPAPRASASLRPVASPMVYDTLTTLPPAEVIARAKAFFAERVPHNAAYPEKEGPTFLVLRGQGGEEIALNAHVAEAGTRVRASTLLFDQAVDRFLSTLPPAAA
jgi:hypothetical protein